MYLKFWGVQNDGNYSPKKGKPRPGWSYRYARRNAARAAHWPLRYRWRVWMKMLREKMAAMRAKGKPVSGPVMA